VLFAFEAVFRYLRRKGWLCIGKVEERSNENGERDLVIDMNGGGRGKKRKDE